MKGRGHGFFLWGFFPLVRLAAVEAIRSPAFLLVSYVGVWGIILLPLVLNFTLGDAARMVGDAGLSVLLVCGVGLAVLGAGETVGGGLCDGRAAVVLAKPISRGQWLFSQFMGVVVALAAYGLAGLLALVLAVRSAMPANGADWSSAVPGLLAPMVALAIAGAWNHRTRRPFASVAFGLLGPLMVLAVFAAWCWPGEAGTGWHFARSLLAVGLLALLPAVIAAALTMALETRLSSMAAGLVTVVLLSCGLTADYLLGAHLASSGWARGLYALLPNIQAFWLADALDEGQSVPAVYVALSCAYAAAYSGFVLALGGWGLRGRDLG